MGPSWAVTVRIVVSDASVGTDPMGGVEPDCVLSCG